MALFVATFKGTKGRYLVERDSMGGCEGQKILNARQEKYGNKPDPVTGYYLNEMVRWFGPDEVLTIKPVER